jgi:phosphoribosyl 1,2-cyclic phosphodiesterase
MVATEGGGDDLPGDKDFFVRFWGVRGSVACAAPDIVRYGGNTSTLEIRCGNRLLIFDAGTGIRYLGNKLLSENSVDAHLFLTHTHFDHICGMPFFRPAFVPENKFQIYAGHLLPEHDIRYVLSEMMMAPLFPVPLEIFQSVVIFRDFHAGETLHPYDDVVVKTAPLNHPNGATGYRIEFGGKSICYLTDTEHRPDNPDENILKLIEGADIVVYDGMYTDDEYQARIGWGHSTWQEGARLCEEANVRQYVVFHHDPDHNDEFMDGIAEQVAKILPGSVVAQEGMVLRPGILEPSRA